MNIEPKIKFENQDEVAKWYILHTYSGYENMVKSSLEQMIENYNLQDIILDIKIPTETVIEERKGKKKAFEAKTMPCYVYVKLKYSSQIWYMLTNTRGITGFVGPNGHAWPLDSDEVKRLRLEEVVVNLDLCAGDNITVTSGPFEGLIGTVKSVDTAHQKADVALSMFGRETNVSMEFRQIEKIANPQVVSND